MALVGALAGCGGAGFEPAAPGPRVFGSSCAACHSVIGNESLHRQGGDLVGYRMSRQELLEFTREMPVRRRLTPAQLDAVVDYVFALQHGGRPR